MEKQINRRAFLKRGAALAGGFALTFGSTLGTLAGESSDTQEPDSTGGRARTYFALATTREDQDKACTRHAANKLFASPEAADQNRAHPGCKCQVIKGGALPEATWHELFGNPRSLERAAVDRRWGWVGQTLKAG
ncbi:MAG: hypothetical protein R3A46_16170 [Thermomicrobiales bacterium]